MTASTIRPMCDLIEPHLRHLVAAGFSANTVDDRRSVLRRVDRDLPMGIVDATVPELDDWLAQFNTNQTKATYYGHIVGFFSWACGGDDPWLDWNPTTNLKRPKVQRTVPRPVSDEQVGVMYAEAREPFRLFGLLGAYAGLRAFEISGIDRGDFTPEWIYVHGKGGKHATVPTHELVWRAVQALPRGAVARGKTGVRLSPTRVSSLFGREMRRIGLEGVSLHRLRHWLGTRSLQGPGGNLRTTQELLRHSSPATTAIYTQVTDEQRRSAVSALPVPTDTPEAT